jgi:hypothetical protein
MFSVRRKMRTAGHSLDRFKQAPTILARFALGTMGSTCRKSPPNTKTLPPKGMPRRIGFRAAMMSRSVTSSASIQKRCCMGASSHTISSAR